MFPYQAIRIQEIKKVFDTLRKLNDDDGFIHDCGLLAAPKGKMYDLKEYFVLLPTLKYAMKFWDKETAIVDRGVHPENLSFFQESLSIYGN